MIRRSPILWAALVAALGLLVAVGYLTDRATNRLLATFAARDHEHRVLENLQVLLTELDDAETGQRGFLITGQGNYLEPYNQSIGEIHQTIQELDGLAAPSLEPHKELTRLKPLVAQKLSELQQTINLREQKGFQAALAVVSTNQGKQTMDQIRAVVLEASNREHEVLVQTDREARQSATRNRIALWAARAVSGAIILAAFLILVGEVSSRKKAERLLQVTNTDLEKRTAELDRYFDLSIDMMCIAGFDGYFKRVNPAWEKGLGYSISELLARPYIEFVHPDDRAPTHSAAASVATGKTVISFENRYKAKDGTYHWLLWNSAPSVEHGMTYAVARDITEEKRAQEAIQKLNVDLQRRSSDLEAANRELEAFTYSVSHDLRAPLRHIDGFSKLLMEEHAISLTDEAQRYLTRVREGTKQMGQLVDDLLNLARVGRKELTLQVTGLNSLVQDVLTQQKADTTGREIEWKVAPLPFVECDPALIKQVFANLISNAVKYTRPRPKTVIEIGVKNDNGASIVFVRDNGVGFSMKYADKLFGVFQRLHRPEDFEGTGVGLATVQRIVHKHGGRVWAEAELDKGATFYFTLGTSESEVGEWRAV